MVVECHASHNTLFSETCLVDLESGAPTSLHMDRSSLGGQRLLPSRRSARDSANQFGASE